MDEHAADGIYRIPAMKGLFRAAARELADAVPPLAPASPPLPWEGAEIPERHYGWVAGSLPSPDAEGRYIVEFVEKRAVRVLAYVDRYGRAFSTDKPLDSHPTREPELKFARYAEQSDPAVLEGCVEVRDAEGSWREAARFRRFQDRYTLYDSWFDFGPRGADLAYPDALTRSYLAFVYRPSLGAPEVPARGLEGIEAPLDALPALPALRKIQSDIAHAQLDPALKPPALARALARWLTQAGLDQLALAPSGSLRLVKTVRYADIFYLAPTEEGAGLSARTIWALQNALNRYLLVKRAFGDKASIASVADVLRWDAYLIDAVAAPAAVRAQEPSADAGEWALRRRIAEAVERMAVPLRFEVEFRADLRAGIVAFKTVVPDADMMPRERWDEDARAVADATALERAAQALRYAEHLAVLLAAEAFGASEQVRRVEFDAHVLWEEGSFSLGDVLAMAGQGDPEDDGEGGATRLAQLLPGADLYVAFRRDAFLSGYSHAAKGDPSAAFRAWGARVARDAFARRGPDGTAADAVPLDPQAPERIDDDPFRTLSIMPSAKRRRDMPECFDAELPEEARAALGARWLHDLRIDSEAIPRRQAERIAARLARAESATEAIGAVRRRQQRADDPFAIQACTRLMAALAEGEADPDDQNTVIRSYLGPDPCWDALQRARALAAAGDAEGAGRVLSETAWKTEAERRYLDDSEVVYRNFDGYASRVVYNLVREGGNAALAEALDAGASEPRGGAPVSEDEDPLLVMAAQVLSSAGARPAANGFGQGDRDRRVELVPDTLLRCHLEAAKLLERSFSGIDAALAHATRAIELSPTATTPRCVLARVYMLMGDAASASETLKAALRLATQPNDIAIAYYQLAYTLWKSGDARTGAACYVKSLVTSPIMAAQVASELQDLLNRESVSVPAREGLDDVLAAGGVPLAPSDAVLDALLQAAERAVDADVFAVGRSLLATYLTYRPDDALMGAYRSLIDLLV